MVQGFIYLHNVLGCVHRDVKPGNVLMNSFGEIRISDFGIVAELASMSRNCMTFVGTTVYMSPERIDSMSYSYPGDIWSMGLALLFCAIGSPPIENTGGYFGIMNRILRHPPPTLRGRRSVSGEVFSDICVDFIDACLHKEPGQRATARELLHHPFVASSLGTHATVPYWPKGLNICQLTTNTSDAIAAGTLQTNRQR
uniref:mitogen-activated protein kinase kinase n=1 Tax=Lygus hesperus TaxID=30085 RepID=A0A0A9XGY2_LYGHE